MKVTEEKILSNFNISKESMVPLYQQLQDQLESLIDKFPCGTRLPSERKLSEELEVDRGTIKKALNYFTSRGVIARRGARGTFIQKDDSDYSFKIHPMALEKFDLKHSANELDFVLYENLPLEKDFWEKTVAFFNAQSQNTKINIQWLPQDVKRSNYKDYIKQVSPDIVQTLVTPDIEDMLVPFSEDIYNQLSGEDYLGQCYGQANMKYLKKFAPIHFSPLVCAWNQTLAEKFGMKDTVSNFYENGIDTVFSTAARKLPNEINVSGHIWDRSFALGLPENPKDINLKFFRQIFDAVSDCTKHPNLYLSRQEKRFEEMEMFIQSKSLFLLVYSSFMFMNSKPEDFDFDFKMAFFPMGKGMIQAYQMISSLGICCTSQKKSAAEEFIKFMISENVQRQIVSMFSAPFMRKAWNAFVENGIINSQEQIDKIISSYRFCPTETNSVYAMVDHFTAFGIRDIYASLADSKITVAEASRQAFSRYEQFRKTSSN
jgi:DNA-binding transcriptional regulator YhcF (GntR family)